MSLPPLDLLKNGCERTRFYALVWGIQGCLPHPRSLSVRWAISTFNQLLSNRTYSSAIVKVVWDTGDRKRFYLRRASTSQVIVIPSSPGPKGHVSVDSLKTVSFTPNTNVCSFARLKGASNGANENQHKYFKSNTV